MGSIMCACSSYQLNHMGDLIFTQTLKQVLIGQKSVDRSRIQFIHIIKINVVWECVYVQVYGIIKINVVRERESDFNIV